MREEERACGSAGAVAVELAIVLPVFLLLVLGLIDVARAIWVQTSLDYAVEAAARCGAVNATSCGSLAAIEAYAAQAAPGLQLETSAFTAVHAACGVQVTATYSFEFVFPLMPVASVTLSAAACYPQ